MTENPPTPATAIFQLLARQVAPTVSKTTGHPAVALWTILVRLLTPELLDEINLRWVAMRKTISMTAKWCADLD